MLLLNITLTLDLYFIQIRYSNYVKCKFYTFEVKITLYNYYTEIMQNIICYRIPIITTNRKFQFLQLLITTDK